MTEEKGNERLCVVKYANKDYEWNKQSGEQLIVAKKREKLYEIGQTTTEHSSKV